MLFPTLSAKKSSEVSKLLGKHITNLRPLDVRLLQPYSARHTFRDKYHSAGVPEDIGKYLVGHKDKYSSRAPTATSALKAK